MEERKRRAAWFLPSLLEGSGGHRTILQNACYLAQRGNFQCDLYVEVDGTAKNNQEMRRRAEKLFGPCPGCRFFLGFDIEQEQYDVLFATVWYSAKVVRDIPLDVPKIYFIQDFEACFNPMGDGYLLACNSYCYGLKPITIGKWLAHKMRTEFDSPGQYFNFCADTSIYRPLADAEKENAICFVYQPEKPRRCSAIGIEALRIVKYLRPDVKIYLYGSAQKGYVSFQHTNLGIISLQECNALYNRCKVGFCISSSNPSRIPFEMMASGLPVVDIYMENNLYDMPPEAITLAHYTPESIAEALIFILDSQELQAKMSDAGKRFMRGRTLEAGYEQFYHAVENVLNGKVEECGDITKLYTAEPVVSNATYDLNDLNPDVPREEYRPGIIGRLKNIPWIRKNRVLRIIWNKMRGFCLRIFQ